ncbi:hypothetical protein HDU96_007595 [Phlyctochytrium bullatum]|nr:hypothetical protein HDU96_007595 [Phlyctochytrium bullatum]
MKLAALAIALFLGLTTVAATPFPQFTDDVDLDTPNNAAAELPDLSLSRALELAHDASNNTSNDDEDLSNDLLDDNVVSRVHVAYGDTFKFKTSDYKKFAFISRRIRKDPKFRDADIKNAIKDFKDQCNKKFPAKDSKTRNEWCLGIASETGNNGPQGGALVATYPAVEKTFKKVTDKTNCNATENFKALNDWCKRAYGKQPNNSKEGIESERRLKYCLAKVKWFNEECNKQVRKEIKREELWCLPLLSTEAAFEFSKVV